MPKAEVVQAGRALSELLGEKRLSVLEPNSFGYGE